MVSYNFITPGAQFAFCYRTERLACLWGGGWGGEDKFSADQLQYISRSYIIKYTMRNNSNDDNNIITL